MALVLHGTISDNTGVSVLSRPNTKPIIINGDMQIAQRATSATTIGNGNDGYHTCDRWRFSELGAPTGEFTLSQDTDVPTGYGYRTSLKFDVTTADTAMAAADLFRLEYRTEAQDCRVFKYGTSLAETATVAFWVKSNKTGTYSFHIRQNDDLRGLTKTYTIDSADTWERKIINIPADTTGVIANDNGIGLMLYWNLAAGADYTSNTQTTYGAVNDNMIATSQGVNVADSTSNEWLITGVQLEVGTHDVNSIPDFQFEDAYSALDRCRRYCMVSGNVGGGAAGCVADLGISISTTEVETYLPLRPEMRSSPSMTNTGNLNVSTGAAASAATAIAINSTINNRQHAGIKTTVGSGLTAHKPYRIEANSDATSRIILDAEL